MKNVTKTLPFLPYWAKYLYSLHSEGLHSDPPMQCPFMALQSSKSLPKELPIRRVKPNLGNGPTGVHKHLFYQIRVGYRHPRRRPIPVQETLTVHAGPPPVEWDRVFDDVVLNQSWLRLSLNLLEHSYDFLRVPEEDRSVPWTPHALLRELALNPQWDPYDWVREFQEGYEEDKSDYKKKMIHNYACNVKINWDVQKEGVRALRKWSVIIGFRNEVEDYLITVICLLLVTFSRLFKTIWICKWMLLFMIL